MCCAAIWILAMVETSSHLTASVGDSEKPSFSNAICSRSRANCESSGTERYPRNWIGGIAWKWRLKFHCCWSVFFSSHAASIMRIEYIKKMLHHKLSCHERKGEEVKGGGGGGSYMHAKDYQPRIQDPELGLPCIYLAFPDDWNIALSLGKTLAGYIPNTGRQEDSSNPSVDSPSILGDLTSQKMSTGFTRY